MPVKVGIPRALLYYNYFPMWEGFFKTLGVDIIVSAKTTKAILDKGVKHSVDDACLPVKLFFGHVLDIKDKVDYLFLPRMVSVERRTYICPKFLGLPDMVRYNIPDLPPLIDVAINMSKNEKELYKAFQNIGKNFTENRLLVRKAFKNGLKEMDRFKRLKEIGFLPDEAIDQMNKGLIAQNFSPANHGDINIAIIGHGYNIYDSYVSMNLIAKLRDMGVNIVTPDNLAEDVIQKRSDELPKKLFWSLGKQMIGSAFHYMRADEIDGIIHVASFGCGPDSFTQEIIERNLRREHKVPLLNLTIDEHTGEAGIITRLEAFVDMINWRREAL